MIRLIYSSALNPAYSPQTLLGLLAGYRARNERMGINSLLLLMNKDFLQMLEGEEAAVDELDGGSARRGKTVPPPPASDIENLPSLF